MANSLTSFDRGRPSTLARSRHSNLLDAARQGIAPSFAVVTYKGRNFRLKYRAEEKMVRDDRGRPATSIDVVIVGISPNISRQYFPRAYTEGDTDGPDCFSTNGITPDIGVPNKQNAVCSTCRWSQWGSRTTDAGKRAKMCQETRRIAVVPLDDIENEVMGGPMLLRIPPMSLNNLSNYSTFLASKGASFETVATRIGFDENVAYPRLSFEVIDWLNDQQQMATIGENGNGGMCAHPLIERMLSEGSASTAPVQAVPQQRADLAREHAAQLVRLSDPRPEPVPEPPPVVEPEPEEEDPFEEEETPSPPPEAKAAPRPRGRPPKTAPTNGKALPVAPAASSLEADIESALDNLLGP